MTYERLKRYRQNRKQGLRWYNLCLPEHLVEMAVVDAGVISGKEADDFEKVRAALQAHLLTSSSATTRRRGVETMTGRMMMRTGARLMMKIYKD